MLLGACKFLFHFVGKCNVITHTHVEDKSLNWKSLKTTTNWKFPQNSSQNSPQNSHRNTPCNSPRNTHWNSSQNPPSELPSQYSSWNSSWKWKNNWSHFFFSADTINIFCAQPLLAQGLKISLDVFLCLNSFLYTI